MMSRSRKIVILSAFILLLLLLTEITLPSLSKASESEYYLEFYFINAIYFINSTRPVLGYLETPTNYTSQPYYQNVSVLYKWGDVYFDKTSSSFAINATPRSQGGFIVKVICQGRNLEEMKNLVKNALKNPFFHKDYDNFPIPSEIKQKYIREPQKLIVENVKPVFENWLSSKGLKASEMSRLSLAYALAYFSYREYITYDPSLAPRSLKQVIETRRGDCDDMSRILVNLLWSYQIPAKIVNGYIYLNYTEDSKLGNSFYLFRNAGPHAFVMVYLPPLGWTSLDLLAGSFIIFPFVIQKETMFTNVTEKEVKEVVEFHLNYTFVQLMEIFDKEEFEKLTENGSKIWKLRAIVEDEIMEHVTKKEEKTVTVSITETVTHTRTIPTEILQEKTTITTTETIFKTPPSSTTTIETPSLSLIGISLVLGIVIGVIISYLLLASRVVSSH